MALKNTPSNPTFLDQDSRRRFKKQTCFVNGLWHPGHPTVEDYLSLDFDRNASVRAQSRKARTTVGTLQHVDFRGFLLCDGAWVGCFSDICRSHNTNFVCNIDFV